MPGSVVNCRRSETEPGTVCECLPALRSHTPTRQLRRTSSSLPASAAAHSTSRVSGLRSPVVARNPRLRTRSRVSGLRSPVVARNPRLRTRPRASQVCARQLPAIRGCALHALPAIRGCALDCELCPVRSKRKNSNRWSSHAVENASKCNTCAGHVCHVVKKCEVPIFIPGQQNSRIKMLFSQIRIEITGYTFATSHSGINFDFSRLTPRIFHELLNHAEFLKVR